MKKVASPTPVTDWRKEKAHWPHLTSLPLGETGGGVDILVGLDHAHLVAVIESRVGAENCLLPPGQRSGGSCEVLSKVE